MRLVERIGLAALHRLDPERAHDLSLRALTLGLVPLAGEPVTSPRLQTVLAGMELPNPIGLAAGYDKNARAVGPLMRAGFGFIELGAATPRPQPGNPKPRLFRLTEDRAIINRFGFNNEGAEVIASRMAMRPSGIPVGLNIGANKDSADRAADFAAVVGVVGEAANFFTVNVSSPNTERLRDLQGADALAALLNGVLAARDRMSVRRPVFLKIAPDLEPNEIEAIADVALQCRIDGIIATNTTLSRQGLASHYANETGGLSGRPLLRKSTSVLARLYRATQGNIPLIGVGGIASVDDAWEKFRAGATAVQLYSGLVYSGLSLASEIARGLDAKLQKYQLSLEALRGSGADDWIQI